MRLIDADELIIFGLDNPDDEHLFQFVPMEIIDSAPTVELPSAERKGKWETAYLDHVSMGIRPKVLYCSECNQCIAYPTNFCPHCGARMVSEDD